MSEIYLTDEEMKELAATAALTDFAVADLIGAAAWAFARQDEQFKEQYVRQVWCERLSNPFRARPRRRTLKEKLHGLARRIVSVFG